MDVWTFPDTGNGIYTLGKLGKFQCLMPDKILTRLSLGTYAWPPASKIYFKNAASSVRTVLKWKKHIWGNKEIE